MGNYYPDGVTQSSFDDYWDRLLDDPEEEDDAEQCHHGVLFCDRCEDCEDEDDLDEEMAMD